MNQQSPQPQPAPGAAGTEATGKAPQFTAVSRERFAGKKWQRPGGYGFALTGAMAPIVAAEIGHAALRLPLAFLQQGDRFILAAVLSPVPGRNMLVAPDGRWLGGYVPAYIRSYPFALLPQQGNPSAAAKQVFDFLAALERSRKVTEAAVSALATAGVIHPWPIKRKTAEGEKDVAGLNRVDEPTFNALSDDAFLKLRKTPAALPIAYAQLLSMGQLGIFEHLERLQAQLRPQSTSSLVAALPESIDSLFGTSSEDTIQFR